MNKPALPRSRVYFFLVVSLLFGAWAVWMLFDNDVFTGLLLLLWSCMCAALFIRELFFKKSADAPSHEGPWG